MTTAITAEDWERAWKDGEEVLLKAIRGASLCKESWATKSRLESELELHRDMRARAQRYARQRQEDGDG